MRRRPRSLSRLLAVLLAALPGVDAVHGAVRTALDESTVPIRSHCALAVLRDLGWQLQDSTSNEMRMHAGAPCDRADLADAQRNGDLRLELPASTAARSALAAEFEALLHHPATICAYAYRLGDATRRAADRLAANPGYRFSAVQFGWIGFGSGGAARDGWERIDPFGRAFRPSAGNRRAIEGFYAGSVRSECGVGRQIAQYAAQAELYGPAFDTVFDADELVIGTFNQLHGTRSILLGSGAGEFVRDGRAHRASQQGRQGFAGLPGFIEHVFDRALLDDINNQAENFVVYDVSADAADALRAHGGFEHYNVQSHALWKIARDAALPGRRANERVLFDRDPSIRAGLSAAQRDAVARMDTILDDPFYRGFRIYVHKQGVKPVGFHFARLLDRNPRTPFRIELVLHNLHTTLYRRYVDHLLVECGRDATSTR